MCAMHVHISNVHARILKLKHQYRVGRDFSGRDRNGRGEDVKAISIWKMMSLCQPAASAMSQQPRGGVT